MSSLFMFVGGLTAPLFSASLAAEMTPPLAFGAVLPLADVALPVTFGAVLPLADVAVPVAFGAVPPLADRAVPAASAGTVGELLEAAR